MIAVIIVFEGSDLEIQKLLPETLPSSILYLPAPISYIGYMLYAFFFCCQA